MRPDASAATAEVAGWQAAEDALDAARREMAHATDQTARQRAWTRFLRAADSRTELIHGWLAAALDLGPVRDPKILFSLDVDGVLEDDFGAWSATGLLGAAALKLLQLGRVGVVLNTARSMRAVQARVSTFQLLGGVAGFGSGTWDAVFAREDKLVSTGGIAQLNQLRRALGDEATAVFDLDHELCVRASRIVDGSAEPFPTAVAHELVESRELSQLTFWVAPRYTDFVAQGVDKWKGLTHIREQMGLTQLPVAAIGDSACDLPMLRKAGFAFLPARTLPSYIAPRGQRLMRSRYPGQRALWDAARQLVPDPVLHARVGAVVMALQPPDWLPLELRADALRSEGIRSRLGGGWQRWVGNRTSVN